MLNSTKAAVLAAGLTGAVAVAWWLFGDHATESAVAVAPTAKAIAENPQVLAAREAKEAALALVAAESREAPPPRIEAPPNFQSATDRSDPGRPKPPPGFAFTAFHGQMAKGRMTEADYEPSDATASSAELAGAGGIPALAEHAAAAKRDWTFGWIRVTPTAELSSLSDRLRELDADVLGRTRDLLRMRLPGDAARLRRIAALTGVAQVTATPANSKATATFLARAHSHPLDQTPAFVTLMTDDPDGRWRQELHRLGAVVGRFDPTIRVYVANIPHAALADILAADFVQAVEPMGRVTATHDAIVPAMGADALRLYDDASGLFSGNAGGQVAIGVMDTGLNVNHVDIVSNRRSICGGNFVPDELGRLEDQDLWVDGIGHGTHVTGTIAGSGSAEPVFAGMAPLVPDIRFAKVLGIGNGTTDAAIGRGMDFLAKASSCGSNPVAAKPLLVNMSLGYPDPDWEGRSASERKLDATVWSHRQLYVVAAGNSDVAARGDFSSAKNSLTVGATESGGDIANFSSHGPTFDGRLKPQIVGTGVGVVSAEGGGTRQTYSLKSGTSMSSPAVAGVAALLMNAVPDFREQPAVVRARLMASAIKPDAFLEDGQMFPLHNGDGPGALQNRYGLGKVSARTSVLNRDQEDGWTSGAVTVEVGDGEYGYHDIEVPAGTSRLDIAMTWDEPPADTFAQTLLNDLDLWVDRDADCPATQPAACGNAASRSTIDNVEWLILRNPTPGTYRLKVVPKRARVQTPRAALAWTIIRGPSTPQLAIDVGSDAVAVAPGSPFQVDVALSTNGYVAAGTVLRIDCRAEPGSNACNRAEYIARGASRASREDNVVRSLARESGDHIALGEIAVGEEQTARLIFKSLPQADRFRLYFTATAWNASSASTSVDISVGNAEIAPSPLVAAPANDDFAAATRLLGASGQMDFDLLLATPEPGEPPFSLGLTDDELRGYGVPQAAVRPRSIWYAWTAPANDTYRFGIAPGAFTEFADNVQLDLFEVREADALASLASTRAKIGGGLTFAARRGQAYRIRLSVTNRTLRPIDRLTGQLSLTPALSRRLPAPLTLSWSEAERPSNDDFGLATAIGGTNGTIEDSNFGATLQSGEFFHPLAGTTWYRWQAPSSGDWHVAVDRSYLRVAVFVGDDLNGLRLVSGEARQEAMFPAGEGIEYRLLVAAADAHVSGSEFTLSWEPGQRPAGNDDMANAQEMAALPSFFHEDLQDFGSNTVEPGEPAESGSRTAWWSWTAPADGKYTWRATVPRAPLRLSVFAANAAGEPTLVAMSDSEHRAEILVSFAAIAGQRYLIAAGLASDAAFELLGSRNMVFQWGPAPSNDDFGSAAMLAGRDGTVDGNNGFATVETGEDTSVLGDASLWWTWRAPEDGWQRFTLSDFGQGGLAIYKMTGDSLAQLELVTTSRRLAGDAEARFQAEAGSRYAIRMGTFLTDGDFVLRWQADQPPAWLRFAGWTLDGDLDAAGNLVEIAHPAGMAFKEDGRELYVATADGLQVYQRDAATGALRFEQQLDGVDNSALLLWDSRASTLVAGSCDGWRKFVPLEAGSGLRDAGAVDGTIGCPEPLAFTDSTNTFVHMVSPTGVSVWQFDDEYTRIEPSSALSIAGATAAAIRPGDDFVYLATDGVLNTYQRDLSSGALSLVHQVTEGDAIPPDATVEISRGGDVDGGVDGSPIVPQAVSGLQNVRILAIDDAGEYLFVFGDLGLGTAAFGLENPAEPEFLATLAPFSESFFGQHRDRGWFALTALCEFADVRTQTLSVDVLCRDSLFSVRLLTDPPALRAEDDLAAGNEDFFGNPLPFFDAANGGAVASPDGRHIYFSTNAGILAFERVGSL